MGGRKEEDLQTVVGYCGVAPFLAGFCVLVLHVGERDVDCECGLLAYKRLGRLVRTPVIDGEEESEDADHRSPRHPSHANLKLA